MLLLRQCGRGRQERRTGQAHLEIDHALPPVTPPNGRPRETIGSSGRKKSKIAQYG
jgi:hypothetical protein